MNRIISKIETIDKKVLIEIDGEYHLFLYTRDLKKSSFKSMIQEESELTQEDYNVLIKYILNRGKKRIMYLLGKQDYPKSKLVVKLVKDGYVQEHIDVILEPFIAKGYINDANLVKRRIETFKGSKSKKELELKLMENGFTQDDIKNAISAQFNSEDELKSATALLEKRFYLKRFKLEEHELQQKALGFLSRKGYPSSICYKAFDLFYNESTDL